LKFWDSIWTWDCGLDTFLGCLNRFKSMLNGLARFERLKNPPSCRDCKIVNGKNERQMQTTKIWSSQKQFLTRLFVLNRWSNQDFSKNLLTSIYTLALNVKRSAIKAIGRGFAFHFLKIFQPFLCYHFNTKLHVVTS
jgi:hypothetical protein